MLQPIEARSKYPGNAEQLQNRLQQPAVAAKAKAAGPANQFIPVLSCTEKA
jgi:hypothetical protein